MILITLQTDIIIPTVVTGLDMAITQPLLMCSALFLLEIFQVFRKYFVSLEKFSLHSRVLVGGCHYLIDVVWLGCILFNSPDSVKIIQDIKTLSL